MHRPNLDPKQDHGLIRHRQTLVQAVILLFAGWCLYALRNDLSRLTWQGLWAAKNALVAASALSLINYALRTLRWQVYLRRLGVHIPLTYSGLTYVAGFAFTLSPGKVGEVSRARYYRRHGAEVPVTATAAAFFIERLLDLLAMVTLALLAFASASKYHVLLWLVVAVMLASLVALAVLPWGRCLRWAQAHPGITASLRTPVQAMLHTILSARALLSWQLLGLGFVLALMAWGAEGTGLWILSSTMHSHTLSLADAVGTYSVAIIVGALSFLPGGLGSTEAVMLGLLLARGMSMDDAALLTLMCRLLTLWLAVGIGWLAVFWLRRNPLGELSAAP